jgi:hypothetical protein
LLYSATIIEPPRPAGASGRCITFAKDSTGITLPRRLTRPSAPTGMCGVRVISGVLQTSRTLKTLMPKTS